MKLKKYVFQILTKEVKMTTRLIKQCKRCSAVIEYNSPFAFCEKCTRVVIKEFFSKENDNLTIKEFREKIENDN